MAQTTSLTQNSESQASEFKWGGGHSPFNLSYGKIMMWFFLVTDSFTFCGLLMSYGSKRFFSNVWPDSNLVFSGAPLMGHAHLPLVFVSLMTFILILSSVTMVMAVHAGHYGKREEVTKWLLYTIMGGITFLTCQVWEWTELYGEGGWWGSFTHITSTETIAHFFDPKVVASMTLGDGMEAINNFFNFFFTITGFHGFHVTIGVILLIVVLINTVNGTYDRRGHYEMVEKIGLYWHFVDLVWVFVFTGFYLI